jgi:hypothetical protein
MKKTIIISMLLLVGACQTYSLRPNLVNENCINEGNKPMVLVAMQNGRFKDSVMTVVKSALEGSSYCVKIIPAGDLGREVIENYRAAIIVNTCHFGRIGCGASKFVKKLNQREKKKVLLFTTSGSDTWRPKNRDVDCVTSASKLRRALSTADSIITKTRAILSAGK